MPHRGSGSGIDMTLSLRSDLGILRAMGPTIEQLQKLEQDVVMALEHADPSSLDVLGFGEISVVLRTKTDDGEYVAKRLPPFKNQAILDRYEDNLNTYLGLLSENSVHVIPTNLTSLPQSDGSFVAYCIQPLREAHRIGPAWLRNASKAEGTAMFELLISTMIASIDEKLGVDSQLANWIIEDDDSLSYLDVTTPLMKDSLGKTMLDLELFMASLPWALRAPARRFAIDEAIDNFHHPRSAVIDLAANLNKEGLEDWIPTVLQIANEQLASDPRHIQLTAEEIAKYYKQDAMTWAFMQKIRRADRFWQRKVRRRTYPFLLPGPINR